MKLKTLILFIVINTGLWANGPESGQLKVELRNQPITSMDVRYNISQLMGEPTVQAIYRWHSETIKAIEGAVLWLKVASNDGKSVGYIRVTPTVPDEGEWAMDSTGSPNWADVIVQSYDADGRVTKTWPAKDAKMFWKAGFSVVDAKLTYKHRPRRK